MSARRTNPRSGGSLMDISAISADPISRLRLFENLIILYIFIKLSVPFLVMLFYLHDHLV